MVTRKPPPPPADTGDSIRASGPRAQGPGDTRADPDRPATNDERIVSATILGRCLHDDWTEMETRFGVVHIMCRGCTETFFHDAERSKEDVAQFLRARCVKPSEDEIAAQLVMRTIEAAGWAARLHGGGFRWRCTFSLAGRSYASQEHRTKAVAICEAAAMVAKSGSFRRPDGRA